MSPWYLGKNHEIEKHTHRLRQFDIRETPFMNKYGNTNSFMIIFGSGHCSGREVGGKSSSVTTHHISRNMTAMFFEFAIIQCLISQLYIKRVCEQFFNLQESEGNWERINGYKGKYQALTPSSPMLFAEKKAVECHTDHISLANYRLKSRHISHEQRLKLRKQEYY